MKYSEIKTRERFIEAMEAGMCVYGDSLQMGWVMPVKVEDGVYVLYTSRASNGSKSFCCAEMVGHLIDTNGINTMKPMLLFNGKLYKTDGYPRFFEDLFDVVSINDLIEEATQKYQDELGKLLNDIDFLDKAVGGKLPERYQRDIAYYEKYEMHDFAVRTIAGSYKPKFPNTIPPTYKYIYRYIINGDVAVTEAAEKTIMENPYLYKTAYEKRRLLEREIDRLQSDGGIVRKLKAMVNAIGDMKTVTIEYYKDGVCDTYKIGSEQIKNLPYRHIRGTYTASTYAMPAKDRARFERHYGKHADVDAEYIVAIYYRGKKIFDTNKIT